MLAKHLDNWRDWGLGEQPSLLKTFNSGQNHHTGLIQSLDRNYILKIFNHSFAKAISTQQWASKIALAPLIIFAKDNVAVFQYETNIWEQTKHIEKADLNKITAALTALHQQPFKELEHLGRFNLLSFCDTYLTNTDALTHAWHQSLMPALKVFIDDPTPWCFCHNDLVKENCLIQKDRALFIDWEFAQSHNPWFDLAAIIYYFDLNQAQSIELLEHYQDGWGHKMQDPIFYAAQIAILWGDLLWNLSRSGMDYRVNNEYRFRQLRGLALKLEITLPNE